MNRYYRKAKQYFQLIRINNWIKNLTILLPVFFAGKLFSLTFVQLNTLIITIITFCLASSFIYIINDLKDVEKDRLHPKKRNRPIAGGNVSKREAIYISIFLFICVLVFQFFLSWPIRITVILYTIMNLVYCYGMKNIAIIDITSISLGFVLRLIAGGMACDVLITHWIIILVFLLMFSIALAKRRDDIVLSNNTDVFRNSQLGYSLQFIDIAQSISLSVTLVAYIIYSVSEDVIQRLGSEYVYITSLPVFLGIIRYLQISIIYKKSGSPVDLILKDRFLIATIFVWLSIFILILYV